MQGKVLLQYLAKVFLNLSVLHLGRRDRPSYLGITPALEGVWLTGNKWLRHSEDSFILTRAMELNKIARTLNYSCRKLI